MNKKTPKEETIYLVCVNKEDYSITVLHFACQKVAEGKGKLLILHVLNPITPYSFGIIEDRMHLERENETKETLKKFKEVVKQYKSINHEILIKEGIIEDEIIKTIEQKNNIDMLIVGSEPETSTKSTVLSSLVSKIGKKLFIPVLIMPGNLSQERANKLI